MKQLLKKILLGYIEQQEYVCVPDVLDDSFTWTLEGQDITNEHLFLGYKPLLIGLPYRDNYAKKINISLQYKQSEYAGLKMQLVNEIGDKRLLIYQGVYGRHRLLPVFNQWMQALKYGLKKQQTSNISLPGNLYNQVKIAYAHPRSIKVVTVGDGSRYNMFPTDLHGAIDDDYYVISLRKGGKAGEQVKQFGRLTLSTVSTAFHAEAYVLGKNHMGDLREAGSFPALNERSYLYANLLPNAALYYAELQLIDTVDCGIHKLYLLKKKYETDIATAKGSALAHIHSLYLHWRIKNNLDTSTYLR